MEDVDIHRFSGIVHSLQLYGQFNQEESTVNTNLKFNWATYGVENNFFVSFSFLLHTMKTEDSRKPLKV